MSDRPTPGQREWLLKGNLNAKTIAFGPDLPAGEEVEVVEASALQAEREALALVRRNHADRVGDCAKLRNELRAERARSQGLEDALSDLVSFAENVPIHEGRWSREHGYDWRANIEKARRLLSLGLPDEEGEQNDSGYEARSASPGDCVPSPSVEAVLVAADRVREAYDAMLEGRDIGRLPEWQPTPAPKAAGPERPEVAHKQESPSVRDVTGEGDG